MSRKYSIGFLILIIIILIFTFLGYEISYNKAVERNETNHLEDKQEYPYILKEKEGYLTVYQSDGQVYEYTSILSAELPVSIQEELKNGIQLESIGEVYGFLENYSS